MARSAHQLLDGTLVALDRADGHEVWTMAAGGGVNGWLAAVDDRLIVPVGNADTLSRLAVGSVVDAAGGGVDLGQASGGT